MKDENQPTQAPAHPAPQAATQPTLYLWLSCEGWVCFGPFRHLRWRTDRETGTLRITDEKQTVIAYQDKDGTRWRATHPDYTGSGGSGWAFRDPMITTTPIHPHPRRF